MLWFGFARSVPAIRVVREPDSSWRNGESTAATTRAKQQKPAACFARRVKLTAQKHFSFRKTEFMI
jgi:hypothetical protein